MEMGYTEDKHVCPSDDMTRTQREFMKQVRCPLAKTWFPNLLGTQLRNA